VPVAPPVEEPATPAPAVPLEPPADEPAAPPVAPPPAPLPATPAFTPAAPALPALPAPEPACPPEDPPAEHPARLHRKTTMEVQDQGDLAMLIVTHGSSHPALLLFT
jgi:hypothetical protein